MTLFLRRLDFLSLASRAATTREPQGPFFEAEDLSPLAAAFQRRQVVRVGQARNAADSKGEALDFSFGGGAKAL